MPFLFVITFLNHYFYLLKLKYTVYYSKCHICEKQIWIEYITALTILNFKIPSRFKRDDILKKNLVLQKIFGDKWKNILT